MSGSVREDNQDPALFGQTPWQTVGPFFHYGLPWRGCADLVGSSDIGARPELFSADNYVMAEPTEKGPIAGEIIEIFGQVRDGLGQPVPDALIEIWQADADGHLATDPDDPTRNMPGFIGFGRSSTSEDGIYRFRTVRPGAIPGAGLAPHIAVGVQGRGFLKRLVTRLFFADRPENASDPLLTVIPEERRHTLIAQPDGNDVWRLDIVLQGEGETVFFDI